MIEGKIALSLFDGMSGGQIALKDLCILISKYYASEIDKFAIQQTQYNFPETIQLGSIVDVDVSKLDKIDILIAGSPCQSFSFVGKMKGMATKCNEEILSLDQYLELKHKGFQFEGQSYLFWEYMRILKDIQKYNPDVLFLLENVEMEKKWERVISEAIGVYGVHINSSLVSAQNRKRVYWTNIRTRKDGLFNEVHSDIPQPKDRGIVPNDIYETEVDDKYFLSEKLINGFLNKKPEWAKTFKPKFAPFNEKANCITQRVAKMAVTDNYIIQLPRGFNKGKCFYNKVPTLTGCSWEQNNLLFNGYAIRRLTPLECARLQTVPEWYEFKYNDPKKGIVDTSDSQQYKMLGNGWTIEVIKHIFSFINQ